MKTLSAALPWILSLVLAVQVPHASASGPDSEMRAALDQMVAAQDLEREMPAILERSRLQGLEIVRRTALDLIAANRSWGEAEGVRARQIMEELAPRVVETVFATQKQQDRHLLGADMIRATYPKYYSAAEISELAAYYASPAYK
jgi:hypothetical protein